MIREEMLENPVLEDSVESSNEQQKAQTAEVAPDAAAERIGETELPASLPAAAGMESTPEVKADNRSDGEAVKDFDWEGYLENQGSSPPLPSYRPGGDDLPSLESTLTRGTSLFDHLEWQMKLGHFSPQEDAVALLIDRQPDARRLPGPAVGGDRRGGGGAVRIRRGGAEEVPGAGFRWGRCPQFAGMPDAAGGACGRRRRGGRRHHHQAPGQPGEEELLGHREGPEPAAGRDLRGGQGGHAVRPQAGAGLHR